ncbi:hypothetical protein UFOVP972_136 [uncultured Caudovirales phage]|uniref:Uncharacterized protein n=1 Tax=uncultured Caudovirales phage TaxID=2100421 RepID=A0A6J5Q153_9CAUD|nr:hypothetical protein UFOVP972_136 [uncultured Caudovirales phage]
MKNIHLLPTDKPSRLGYLTKKGKEVYKDLRLFDRLMPNILDSENQHLYITSDEEIKEGVNQWYLDKFLNKPRNSSGSQYGEKQDVIILTTDQDLIKDGVQAIDDNFLEWFVENPSCEEVEIVYDYFQINQDNPVTRGSTALVQQYKIIIPKEEHKQETLKEAAERYENKDQHKRSKLDFIEGAKWQHARMYSEEDLREAYFSAIKSTGEGWNGEYTGGNNPNIEEVFGVEFETWKEQFKKKQV